jgi:hypothetical protein
LRKAVLSFTVRTAASTRENGTGQFYRKWGLKGVAVPRLFTVPPRLECLRAKTGFR